MTTNASFSACTNKTFRVAVMDFLKGWAAFLDGPDFIFSGMNESTSWLSEAYTQANKHYGYVNYKNSRNVLHRDYTSWNDFFHRQIDLSLCPVIGPDDLKVLVSPIDGKVFNIARSTSTCPVLGKQQTILVRESLE